MQEFLFPRKAFAPPAPQETSIFVLCGSGSAAERLRGAKRPDRLLFPVLISETPPRSLTLLPTLSDALLSSSQP